HDSFDGDTGKPEPIGCLGMDLLCPRPRALASGTDKVRVWKHIGLAEPHIRTFRPDLSPDRANNQSRPMAPCWLRYSCHVSSNIGDSSGQEETGNSQIAAISPIKLIAISGHGTTAGRRCPPESFVQSCSLIWFLL